MIRLGTRILGGVAQRQCGSVMAARYFSSSTQHQPQHGEHGSEPTTAESHSRVTIEDLRAQDQLLAKEEALAHENDLFFEQTSGPAQNGRNLYEVVRNRITGTDITSTPGYHIDHTEYPVNLEPSPTHLYETEEEMLRATDKYGLFDSGHHDDHGHHDEHHDDHGHHDAAHHDDAHHKGAAAGHKGAADHHDHGHHKEHHHEEHHGEEHHDEHHHEEWKEETESRGYFLNRTNDDGVDFSKPFFLMFGAVPLYFMYSLNKQSQKVPDYSKSKEIYLNQVNPKLRDHYNELKKKSSSASDSH
ncbi:hypothetical protein SAMD00019534_059350 [Acytostelium subglobosum LB1]|uniref:hypothetical protein n=1 Tax=Acytostelium subglobosum LB1 TaxID=1410327 RepID=UPI000644A60E|nr:hypothetical protein SAMD00019534_059350 [Acytostelium subglobosum LB1]GAM22760.1 hypothetical protein SAMD00019534_059350 [Acytostelium subglobosum LB1]|eukprot:XP_012753987.1 hypothetical protein SAMD00019534_059350 [Acytostelium subglobosum LB1]